MDAASPTEPVIFQIKITLIGVSKPRVWRRVLVPAEIRIDRFHEVIQVAMGWLDYHMHVFATDSAEFGVVDSELGHRDERTATLAQLVHDPGDRIRYTYDFGDGWEHDIVLEKVLAAEPGTPYPSCLVGKSASPPEDCGGVWGYAHLREVLADPTAQEHDEMLEWLELESAAEFDPAIVDIDAINESLAFISAIR